MTQSIKSRRKRYEACDDVVCPTGFEPATFGVGVRRAIQLRHGHVCSTCAGRRGSAFWWSNSSQRRIAFLFSLPSVSVHSTACGFPILYAPRMSELCGRTRIERISACFHVWRTKCGSMQNSFEPLRRNGSKLFSLSQRE